jgi:hypothetical protein
MAEKEMHKAPTTALTIGTFANRVTTGLQRVASSPLSFFDDARRLARWCIVKPRSSMLFSAFESRGWSLTHDDVETLKLACSASASASSESRSGSGRSFSISRGAPFGADVLARRAGAVAQR